MSYSKTKPIHVFLQASAGVSVFGLAYWSLFKGKDSDQISSDRKPAAQQADIIQLIDKISSDRKPAAQQADIIQLIDKESRKSSIKYWQGELKGRGSDGA